MGSLVSAPGAGSEDCGAGNDKVEEGAGSPAAPLLMGAPASAADGREGGVKVARDCPFAEGCCDCRARRFFRGRKWARFQTRPFL